MSTKWRFLPKKETIKKHKWLKFLHRHMHHQFLWHFGRQESVKACIIGGIMCMMPMPFQMIPATILAFIFRANLIITIAVVWISNPITTLPMMYGAYLLGCWIYGEVPIFHQQDLTWHEVMINLHTIFLPLITGAVIIGLLGGVALAIIVWILFYFVKSSKQTTKM